MKNINKIIRMASVGAALAVVFAVAFVSAPKTASACYSFYGGCDDAYSYSTPYYYQNRNVYVQPQVVYQQPQVIYQQPQVVYQQPTYAYNYQYPLSVSCSANQSTVSAGQTVTWNAYASGGNGLYSYTWSGTTGSYTSGSTGYSTYYNPGSYSVSVTVYSNGQSATQSCGYVTVYGAYYSYVTPTTYAYASPTYVQPATVVQPTTVQSNGNGGMVAACFANETTAQIGTPVTWAVEVTGGAGGYTYQWSGTDGLSGTGSSATQSYSTVGTKNAAVLITSNGQTISQACGDSVDVRSYVSPGTTNYQGAPTSPAAPATSATNAAPLSANALFSLGNIPWGWIAILIIIVLIVAVFYLLFNRHKV